MDRKVLGTFIATRKRTGVVDSTVRRDLAFLGSVFTAAIRRGWVDTSRITALDKRALKESRSCIRLIACEELNRLHDTASGPLKPILVLAIETDGAASVHRACVQLETVVSGLSCVKCRL